MTSPTRTAATTPAPASPATPPKRTMTYNQLSSCPDMEPAFVELYERCRPFTMTSLERMYGLWQAVNHIHRHRIPGDIIECGVWRGGSAMLAAATLVQLGDTSRHLWLYDTFSGMTDPTDHDRDYTGSHAAAALARSGHASFDQWCLAPLDDVRANMASTGYPPHLIHFIVGPVEQTIPAHAPASLALLRLDTDWYDSTRHELIHLYPRLAPGGALIIDDYGHWQGCRRAVDEFFTDPAHAPTAPLLTRLDYTGRIAIKP
jgi:hypothetical protein